MMKLLGYIINQRLQKLYLKLLSKLKRNIEEE